MIRIGEFWIIEGLERQQLVRRMAKRTGQVALLAELCDFLLLWQLYYLLVATLRHFTFVLRLLVIVRRMNIAG